MIIRVITWFEDFFTKGGKRIHAAVLLIGTVALSATVLMLAAAVYRQHQSVGVEMAAACSALAGVIGYAYGRGKAIEEGAK